ncbi:MAG: DUF3567 domain-containing protein [Rubrivivax sp.]
MQMLYDSDNFVVVQFEVPTDQGSLTRGGYEIVDKFARKEIFIEGLLAERFEKGVQELAAGNATADDYDSFIEAYTELARQPLTLH